MKIEITAFKEGGGFCESWFFPCFNYHSVFGPLGKQEMNGKCGMYKRNTKEKTKNLKLKSKLIGK